MVVHIFSTGPDAPYQRTIKRWEYLPGKWRVEVWDYASDADEIGIIREFATFSGNDAERYAELFAANFTEIEPNVE